jgi:hypothetical protein
MNQFYGGAENILFSGINYNNKINRERNKYLEFNDTQTLLKYLKNKQIDVPAFFYVIQIDKPIGRITIFLVDNRSIMD